MKTGMKINLYAPGDGSLDFTLVDAKGQCEGSPTLSRAKAYFLRSPKARHLREEGYRLVRKNKRATLVPNVRRIDHDTLELHGKKFRYRHTDTPPAQDDGPLEFNRKTEFYAVLKNNDILDIKNFSIRASLSFFLAHEHSVYKELT